MSKIRNTKISKNHLKKKLKRGKCLQKKKCFPLSFPILGGRHSTRALKSSPFQKYKNLRKSQNITFKNK